MNIGIYARGLRGSGGVTQYISAMCRAVIDTLSASDTLYIFHNLDAPYFTTEAAKIKEVSLRSKNRFYCDLVEAPDVMNRYPLDVVWFTKYVVPFGLRAKTITTVHDMAYYMPSLAAYTAVDTLYMRVMIRNSCRRADRVVAVSENTKQDVMRILRTPNEKISVIHEAADERYRPVENKKALHTWRNAKGLSAPFILFTGGISPRKNLERLIAAYEAATTHIPHKLVLTGGKGWNNKSVTRAIAANPDIIKLGFVPDDEMPLLYSAADLFVYPSLYEGFGLPILEAQQCGCPVLAGRGSSLGEVAGDGVRFINPLDIAGLSNAIVETAKNDVLKQSLRRRGYENTKRFSWRRAAEQLLEVMGRMHRNGDSD